MTLVERHKELATLQGRFEDSVCGMGRVVLITGTVASGKTELLATFAGQVTAANAMFLGATGASAERDLPLGVVGQVLGGADVDPDFAARLMADGQRMALGRTDSTTTQMRFVHVLRGVSAMLLDLARDRPLVIGIDDIQVCDALSLHCILYLVRRMRCSRLLLVLNEAASPEPATLRLHAELLSQPHCSQLALPPLSRRGVAELLQGRVDRAHADRLAVAGHDATGGNPLLAQALAMDQSTAGLLASSQPPELVVGEAFGQAVVNYLYRSPPEHRDVARAVAVLDSATSPALVSRLVGISPAAATRTLVALDHGGLLRADRLRHPRARTAILDDIHASGACDLHRRAAELLYGDLAPPKVVAEHLLAADAVDFPWASAVLRTAAEDALDDGKAAFAADCLKLAMQVAADGAERAWAKAVLARVEWREDPSLAARHVDELGEAIRNGDLTGRAALMVICWILWYGRADQAIEAIEQVCKTSEEPDPELDAELRCTKRWIAFLFPAAFRAHRSDQLAAAPDQSPEPDCPGVHSSAIVYGVLSHGIDDGTVVRMEEVLRRTKLDDPTLATLTTAITVLISADEFDKAAAWCRRLSSQAGARQAPTWQAILSAMLAVTALRRGEVAVAMRAVRTAFDLLPPAGWGVAVGLPLSTMLLAATAVGDFEEAARQLYQPIPESMFQSMFALPYLHARGNYYLATNRVHAALDDFHACGRLMDAWGIEMPSMVPWRTDAALAWLRLGNPDAARQLVADQLRLMPPGRSAARGTALRVQAATSTGPLRLALITEAVETLEAGGNRLELVRALADLSRLHLERGEIHLARPPAKRAWAIARECSAEALCRSLVPALTPNPVRTAAPAAKPRPTTSAGGTRSLSDAERRVATLAARGWTNRQIAHDLYITVSTVEQHLTQVYRKLKVRRRTDLASRVLASAIPDDRARLQ
jgi:DNA-binding CsgD family transcriptional regulator